MIDSSGLLVGCELDQSEADFGGQLHILNRNPLLGAVNALHTSKNVWCRHTEFGQA